MKSEYYKLVEIEGKGIGCVAVKKINVGTLILSEKPQVIAKGMAPSAIFFKTLMPSFNNLTNDDQEEYLNLHNRFDKEKPLFLKLLPKDLLLGMNPEEIQTYSDQVLKISNIYKTNAFDHDGVGIQVSRFNHSCSANAASIWDEQKHTNQIRTVSKINIGDEICINYSASSLFMKNLQIRQDWLLLQWGFKCNCTICLEETRNTDSNRKYERYSHLESEAKSFEQKSYSSHIFGQLDIIRRQIDCYKEMYKIALEKKPARSHLVNLLDDGFIAATRGYCQCKVL